MSKGNILIIDDDPVICDIFCAVLHKKGYTVSPARTGIKGINLAKKGTFDVIVTDLKMPDIDGIDVLKQIKADSEDNIVILHTGHPSFESLKEALRNGVYDYLSKPCSSDELIFVINKAVTFRNLINTNRKLVKELEEQNISLEEKIQERTSELRLLYNMSRDILSSLDLDIVLKTIIDNVSFSLEIEICSILLLDENDILTIKYATGLAKKFITQTKIKKGEHISGWVAQNKKAVFVEDIEKDPRFAQRNAEKYYTKSFISIPLLINEEVVGVLNINNKKSKKPFEKEDFHFAKSVANEAAMALKNARLYISLKDTYLKTITALTSAIDVKDHYTKNHLKHVSLYAVAIAEEMGMPAGKVEDIRRASQLHDIGKIGIHDNILTKAGKLTQKEWEEMKSHVVKSVEILQPLTFLRDVTKIVAQHHERYDGQGYPKRIKGENIELGARILTVADSFSAMITNRPYRKALTKKAAMEEFKKCSGTQFDPKVVETFLKILKKNPKLAKHKG